MGASRAKIAKHYDKYRKIIAASTMGRYGVGKFGLAPNSEYGQKIRCSA
jgi:hypothetical protein